MRGTIEQSSQVSPQSNRSSAATFRVLGHHYLIELYGCTREILVDINVLEKAMVEAAESAGATVVDKVFHGYSPQGLSGVVVISESHLTVHTWPELEYAAVDVFTCGRENLGEKIGQALIRAFRAREHRIRAIDRGLVE